MKVLIEDGNVVLRYHSQEQSKSGLDQIPQRHRLLPNVEFKNMGILFLIKSECLLGQLTEEFV